MTSLLRVSSILLVWILISLLLLFGVIYLFSKISKTKALDSLLLVSSKNILQSPSEIPTVPKEILAAISAGDARTALVGQFLKENNSPMLGREKIFIEASDKYNLDWKLLPAIAFQESSLGKKTPFGTYNAFGWGVIDNTTRGADFDNWEEAIFSVAKGLREDYYNQGLTTLESINDKYAGDEEWHKKVLSAMKEITN